MNWPTVNFLDVVKDVSGGNVKIPQSEFIKAGEIPVIDQGKNFIAGFTNNKDALFKSSGLPVVIFGDHTKAIKYVDFPFAMGADGVKVLAVKDALDSKFLYHYLRQVKIPEAGYSRHYKFLKELKIPLPPIEEQRRIVLILDKAESLRVKRGEAITKLDQITQSMFLEIFGDPMKTDHPKIPIKNVARVYTGKTPDTSIEEYFNGAIPFITPSDLGGVIFDSKRHLSNFGAEKVIKVDSKSTMVCCIGATIGKVGMNIVPACFNQQINAITWSEKVNPIYGYYLMTFYSHFIAESGASTTLPILKKSLFENIRIPIPPIDKQNEFAVKFNKNMALRNKFQKSLDSFDNLIQSLKFIL